MVNSFLLFAKQSFAAETWSYVYDNLAELCSSTFPAKAIENHLPFAEGFGFNGNILETNILNLGVVLGIVISFGGDALRSLLENRKQTIANNLQQAEKRAEEAKERLAQAKSQLELSQTKAFEIKKQGKITAKKERRSSPKRQKQEIYRLTEKKEENLRVEQQKAISQVYKQLVDRVMNRVKERLSTQLDASAHSSVINFQIVLLSKYSLAGPPSQ